MSKSDSSLPPISTIMARRLAHVMRTPLGVVLGSLTEVGTSPIASDPALARFITLARSSAGQLVDLAERIDWAGRVEHVTEETPTIVEWPKLVRSCVESRCVERQGRSRKQVDVSIDEAVREGRAHGAAAERALAELLDNAVRHARTTVRVAADVDGEFLRVRVADDGPGLPDGGAGVFAPPNKLASRVGFGLWLVERIAAALQGSVSIERTGDKGTVMVLRIPLTKG